MKIGYLLGACGLAVTSAVTAHAESRPAPGTDEFRQMVDEASTAVREGRTGIRNLTHLNGVDDIVPMNRSGAPTTGTRSRAIPHSWAAMIDGDDFVLDFEDPVYQVTTLNPTTASPFITISGVVDPNGNAWLTGGAATTYVGIVDNAAAQTGPRWDPDGSDDNPLTEGTLQGDPDQHGEVGGPDQVAFKPDGGGSYGKMKIAAAGSMATQQFSSGSRTQGWLTHKFFAPTASTPVVTILDMYFDRVDATVWWAPLSETEGNFFVLSSYWFGYTFGFYSILADPDGVFRRPLILGPRPRDPNTGNFFVHPASSPWRLKTDEWTSVAIRQAIDSYSIWVHDSQTIGVNGFAQNSIYDGVTGGADPGNTQGAYAGEIFENDWLQLCPGMDDDPATTTVIEGYGQAVNEFSQNYDLLIDGSGSPAGPTFNAVGIDAMHWRGGFDPATSVLAGFKSSDVLIDNYVVMGDPFPLPDPKPDRTIPFVEDIEFWTTGALSLQGDDWFVQLLQNPAIVDYENNTVGGTQAIEQVAVFRDNVYQEMFSRVNLPIVSSDGVTPVTYTVGVNISDNFLSRGIIGRDNVSFDANAAHVIFGGRDSNFLVDNFIYARQSNADTTPSTNPFDPTSPTTDQSGANVIDNGTDNVGNVNVRLTDGGGTPLTVPTNSWFEFRSETGFDAVDGLHPVTYSFDFGGGFVTAIPDPSNAAFHNPRGFTALTSGSNTINRAFFTTGGEIGGLLSAIYIDDIALDGPRTPYQYVQEVEGGDYAGAPETVSGWGLPFFDDMSSYQVGGVIDDQGWSPFLETLFSDDNGELDIIDVTAAPVAGVTNVFTYTIDGPEVIGTLPGGPYIGGEVVAIVDNLPPFFDPTTPAIVPGGNGTRVNYRDASRIRQGAGDWTLNAASSAPWDGVTPVIGRFQFQYDERWAAIDTQNSVLSDPTGSGRGTVIALQSVFSGDANTGDTDFVVGSRLPEAKATGGAEAVLSFDMYIGDGDLGTTVNSGRTVWTVQGIGVNRSPIAEIAFGGPNNFEDLVSFDSLTGVVSPGPDGIPDNFQFNDFASDPSKMYVKTLNPVPLAPVDYIWVQQSDDAPTDTWVTCEARIKNSGDWSVTIDDGVNPVLSYSGQSLTDLVGGGSNDSGTDYFQIDFGNDEGSQGAPELPNLEWYSLGVSAAPEGGLDPLVNYAGPGAFNDTLKNFYYEVLQVLAPALNVPQIQDVNVGDGSILGPRDILADDHVVFWNNEQTDSIGGANVPLNPSQTPRNGRWHYLDSGALDGDYNDPSDILARGTWQALGLPGATGVSAPAQPGGIINNAPPYGGEIPFEDMLMGSLVGYQIPATTEAPRHITYVDNISLDLDTSCLFDLTGDGATNGADLGLLLGNWGNPGFTDLNNDGTTNGADLGLLLGAWGPGPC